MKNLNESMVSEAVLNVLELRKDLKDADYLIGKEKKALAEKYNTQNKAKEIKMVILKKLQELRKDKKEFDNDDLHDFYLMSDNTSQMIEQLKNESIEFAIFLRNNLFDRLKKYRLESYAAVKQLNYYNLSIADKYKIKEYQAVDEYIKSEDPDTKAQKMKIDDMMNVLNKKLTAELEDFKVEFLKRVDDSAGKQYDNLPNEIKKLENELEKIRASYEERKPNLKNWHERYRAEEPIRKQESKISHKKSILKIYKTKQSFIDACHQDAEKTFRSNVDALTHRVYDKNFDIDNIKVSNVNTDPKIFKLLIDDGNKKLYCRSILAAEFSDKMIPHFRFIMTERK